MKKHKEFIRAIQDLLDSDPDMPADKRIALEAAIATLKKDRRMEVLRILVPFLGQIGKTFLDHHGHW